MSELSCSPASFPTAAEASSATVFLFPGGITMPQRGHLARWFAAGQCMGLSDVEISRMTPDGQPHQGYVLIWVRENADPAYRVVPEGRRWLVIDHVRDRALGRFNSFDAALHFIRPVLPAALSL